MRSPLLLLLPVVAACATLPTERPVRGLFVDLRKAVAFQASNDWIIDRLEIDDAIQGVMRSVCSTPPHRRAELVRWLEDRIEEEGGPSDLLFELEGDTRRVDRIQGLERTLLLLDEAERYTDECPYWLEHDEDFAGLESDEGRFAILGETSGGGSLIVTPGGDVNFGGGGGGRLLPGGGIARRLSIFAGLELGGAGFLPENTDGTRTFSLAFAGAVPLLFRIQDITRIYDIELALTGRYVDESIRYGARVAVAGGLNTPRVLGLMPYAVLQLVFEVHPPTEGYEMEYVARVGTRVGFDWAP